MVPDKVYIGTAKFLGLAITKKGDITMNRINYIKYCGLIALIMTFISIIPLDVYAKDQDVDIEAASASGTTVTVTGTTTANAVTVQVRNSSNEICGMGTIGVSGGSFSGTVTNLRLSNGNYKIYVADFEGGNWAKNDVTVTNGVSASSSSHSSSDCTNGHDYQYTVIIKPTRTTDGFAAYVCTRCGAIDKNHPGTDYRGYIRLPSYKQYNIESIAQIKNAPAGTLTIDAEMWISFHKSVYEEIEKRPDLTVSVAFEWEGNDYLVTIPAGTKAEDVMNGLDYAGYVHLSSLFGWEPIVREK